MIRSFRKFFEFAGRQSRNWYLGLFYEIIRCILEALQFAALLVVLDGLVRDNITTQTALLAFGIMLVSVIGTIIFWYLAHGKEGEGSYRMCEDKRIQIGNRMKYMPMGYFNSHSLGNLTSVSTATMSDLESMSFAIIVRTLVGRLWRWSSSSSSFSSSSLSKVSSLIQWVANSQNFARVSLMVQSPSPARAAGPSAGKTARWRWRRHGARWNR